MFGTDNNVFPESYEEWRFCITQKCGIPLTMDFIKSRIEHLSDESSEERKKFIKLYGIEWTEQVVGFFKQALKS